MKGAIFNIFESFIVEKFGAEAYEDILDKTELETKEPFISAGTYPDSDFMSLVGTTCKKYQLDPNQASQLFGEFTFFKLAASAPHFVEPFSSAKSFLLSVDSVIHVEVKKLNPDAYLPDMRYTEPARDELIIYYQSKRKLYAFMEGLITGVASYFKETIDTTFQKIEEDGSEIGRFHLKFK